jgi:uncharacterized membrane protein
MNGWFYLKLYLGTFAAFLLIDLIWLGVVAKNFYGKQLGHLLAAKTNWAAAIAFYLLFIVGVLVFVVVPALEADSLNRALLYGALFGFFTYATYDLTNLATLEGWPPLLTAVDLVWGTVLCTLVSAAGFLIGKAL